MGRRRTGVSRRRPAATLDERRVPLTPAGHGLCACVAMALPCPAGVRMPALFQSFKIGSLELENRIVIAPMCQYSAHEGNATDWHAIHLGHLALSGASLLIIEAT